MFVEPCSQDSLQYICESVHRHPKRNFKTFNANLETQIMQLNKDKKNDYITDDFNVSIDRNLTSIQPAMIIYICLPVTVSHA